jgi:hypothetical protein
MVRRGNCDARVFHSGRIHVSRKFCRWDKHPIRGSANRLCMLDQRTSHCHRMAGIWYTSVTGERDSGHSGCAPRLYEARLLPGTDDAYHPFWCPDSKYIGLSTNTKLKKIAIDKGTPESICAANSWALGNWGADGTIVFGDGTGGLSRVSAAGGTPTALTTPDRGRKERGHFHPQFLPDGQHILYSVLSSVAENQGIFLRWFWRA